VKWESNPLLLLQKKPKKNYEKNIRSGFHAAGEMMLYKIEITNSLLSSSSFYFPLFLLFFFSLLLMMLEFVVLSQKKKNIYVVSLKIIKKNKNGFLFHLQNASNFYLTFCFWFIFYSIVSAVREWIFHSFNTTFSFRSTETETTKKNTFVVFPWQIFRLNFIIIIVCNHGKY
jgi:hypothetical protein